MSAAVRSVLNQDFADFELIVSDNSDEGCLREIEAFGDARLRYVRPETRLPAVPHWNYAFSHARGDWQVLVCDDDAIAPSLLRLLDRLIDRHEEIDTIGWLLAPHAPVADESAGFETLAVPDYAGGTRLLDCRTVLRHMFASGTGMYGETKREVPLLSHAAYSRRVIERVRQRYRGDLFLHICPMTTAAAAALACSSQTLRIDIPMQVLGCPPDSAGGHRKDPTTYRRMHRDAAFVHTPVKTMSNFPSVTTESLLRAQAALPDLLGEFQIDWVRHFHACYEAARQEDGSTEELQMIDEALATFPRTVRDAVRAGNRRPVTGTDLSRRLANGIGRRLRMIAGRGTGYRQGCVVRLHDANLSGVSDCARHLGEFIAAEVESLIAPTRADNGPETSSVPPCQKTKSGVAAL